MAKDKPNTRKYNNKTRYNNNNNNNNLEQQLINYKQ